MEKIQRFVERHAEISERKAPGGIKRFGAGSGVVGGRVRAPDCDREHKDSPALGVTGVDITLGTVEPFAERRIVSARDLLGDILGKGRFGLHAAKIGGRPT